MVLERIRKAGDRISAQADEINDSGRAFVAAVVGFVTTIGATLWIPIDVLVGAVVSLVTNTATGAAGAATGAATSSAGTAGTAIADGLSAWGLGIIVTALAVVARRPMVGVAVLLVVAVTSLNYLGMRSTVRRLLQWALLAVFGFIVAGLLGPGLFAALPLVLGGGLGG